MRISDWSSDVCSSDLLNVAVGHFRKEISSARADGADSLQRVHALGPTDFDLMIAALFDQLKVVHRPFGITANGEFLRSTGGSLAHASGRFRAPVNLLILPRRNGVRSR